MKKIIFGCTFICCSLFLNAQSVSEGLLFGIDQMNGTARYRGLSGAFGALGGDLTAIGINPAGSTVFANNYGAFSLAFDYNSNDAIYGGSQSTGNNLDFSLNQAGFVFVFEDQSATVNKFSIGFNYDSTRNFDNEVLVRGNTLNSVSGYFLENANGFPLEDLALLRGDFIDDRFIALGETRGFGFPAQVGFLGLNSEVIEAIDPNDLGSVDYISNTGTGTFAQDFRVLDNGYRGKFTVNGGLEIDNWLSLGMNLNFHFVDRERLIRIFESNNNSDALISEVNYVDSVTSEGAGFSLNLGMLAKVTQGLRLGAAYESPTWFTIEDSQSLRISTFGAGQEVVIDPRVLTLYPAYNLRTPGSWTGSIAYVFGKKGLLSADIQSKNYGNMMFEDDGNFLFLSNNNFIDQNLQNALTYKIGGEYRIKNWTLRGGYTMSESPYENEQIMGDMTGYSAGLGYSWGKIILDATWTTQERDYALRLLDSDFTENAMITNKLTNVIFTLGFNF